MQLPGAGASTPLRHARPGLAAAPQKMLTAMVASQLGTIVIAAGSDEYVRKRRGVLAAFRLAGAFTPVFHAHARFMMQVRAGPARWAGPGRGRRVGCRP